jgi:serine/threonine-protein kinase RsbW
MTELSDLIRTREEKEDSIEVTLVCHTSEDGVEKTYRLLKSDLHKMGYIGIEASNIMTAFNEAYSNAYRYGNKKDSKKDINIKYTITRKKVQIEIKDQGEGFDFDAVPEEVPLDAIHGRGINVMKGFMSSVKYEESGSKVIMVYNKPSE